MPYSAARRGEELARTRRRQAARRALLRRLLDLARALDAGRVATLAEAGALARFALTGQNDLI